jgi:multidrug resistance efflux pump
MRRIIHINLLVVLAIVVVPSVAGYLLYNNYYFYSTDDAQVTGNIVNVVSTTPGTLNSLTVQIGNDVSANQVVGTVQVASPVKQHVRTNRKAQERITWRTMTGSHRSL